MSVAVTWWGHATTTIALGGRRVLTDPVLTARVAHLRRLGGALPGGAALDADTVVVSHLHRDHLHVPSLRLLAADTRVVAPRGTARALGRQARGLRAQLEEVVAGDVVDLGGVSVEVVPAHHDGRRSAASRRTSQALGFVLVAAGERVWFAGDTGLFDGMTELGPVDVAVVPIGGWGPTLGPTHLDPEQAVEAVRRVGAHEAIPIHYATFWPIGLRRVHPPSFARRFTAPGADFAAAMATTCPGVRAHVPRPGGTVVLAGRC